MCGGKDDAEVARRAAAIGRKPDDMRASGDLAGTPAEVVEALGGYARAGAATIYLQVIDLSDLDHLELLASKVLRQVPA